MIKNREHKSKFTKKDYLNVSLLVVLYLVVVSLVTHGTFVYGSTVDWNVQHWAIPEYFRNLFYQTGDIIPNFAPNLGGGQNIFYFAYYGFLSPIILTSYLLPNIQMYDFISYSSIFMGILSTVLFYKWLKNHNFKTSVCLAASVLFLCAGPLIFQSHRHIMFMNYMPFVIMALMGVDSYFKTEKRPLLIISVFLIIMTSYFYSVGAIAGIAIYGIYVYLNKYPKEGIKHFFKEAFKFALPIVVAILMSCVLLLPVLHALLSGRIHGDVPVNIMDLISPHFGLEYILYSPYSVGLTAIVVIALFCNLIFPKRDNRFLNIALIAIITMNIFVYFLNGTLYLDGKALIPLLPLYVLAIALFLKRVLENKIALYNILSMSAILMILVIIFARKDQALLFIIDAVLMLLLIYYYYQHKREKKLLIPIMALAFTICVCVNFGDILVLKIEHQKENDQIITDLIKEVKEKDDGYYRIYTDFKGDQAVNRVLANENTITLYSSTYNKEYNKFFFHTFNNNIKYRNSVITHENKNSMFETYMGVKYFITNKSVPLGYEKVKTKGEYTLYKNNSAMPIGYASNNILSDKQYKALKYPYKLEALMNNIIVNNAPKKALNSKMEKFKPNIVEKKYTNLDIKNKGHRKFIKTKNEEPGFIHVELDKPIKDEMLLVRIHVTNPQSCNKGDTSITINGVKNKLTCREWKYYNHNQTFDYTLSRPNGVKTFDIKFSKGTYTINDVQIFTFDYDNITNLKNNVDEFRIDKEKTKGDMIKGNIDVKKDGFFMLTIPYDDGFKLKVDGKEQKYQEVSGAFIGFPIVEGFHEIEITYESPNFKKGLILTIIGTSIFIIILIYDNIRRRKQ